MIASKHITHLSFDCYGTLIDWETGITNALQPVLSHRGISIDREQLLSLYAQAEADAEGSKYIAYRQVLRRVSQAIAVRLGFDPSPDDLTALENSIKDWPPFADTTEALRKLKSRYKLVIISNIDNDLFDGSAVQLQVPFDWVITAQQARAYKPSVEVFEKAQAILDIDKKNWLHCAQSLYHDIVPCKESGISCCWVNRRKGQEGSGATPQATAKPDFEVPDLQTLAAELTG